MLDMAFVNCILAIFVLLAGLCVGSFIDVCIHRMPLGMSVFYPPSHCPRCFQKIRMEDNIPLLSYICLRGRCRVCNSPIPFRSFLVELLSGTIFVVFFYQIVIRASNAWTPTPRYGLFAAYVVVASALVIVTFVDAKHFIVPDSISIGGAVLGPVVSFACPALQQMAWQRAIVAYPPVDAFLKSLVGLAVGAGIVFAIRVFGRLVFRKEAMGLGDVKLMAFLGAWLGWKAAVIINLASPFFGLVYGVGNLVVRRKHEMPYGPFLALSAFLYMLFVDWVLPHFDAVIRSYGQLFRGV